MSDPLIALEKLLEVRGSFQRAADRGHFVNPRLAPPANWKPTEEIATVLHTLDRATAYFWAAPIVQQIERYAHLPATYRISEAGFPTTYGFVWYEQPLQLTAEDSVQAWAWRTNPERTLTNEIGFQWARGRRRDQDEWVPLISLVTRAGATVSDEIARFEEPEMKAFVRGVAASASFMEQEIVVPGGHVRRAVAKRYEHVTGTQPTIRIVELRKRRLLDGARDDEASERKWAHRWVVREHRRNQFFPSLGIHKSITIRQHLKGPPDKPLLAPRTTIFAVDR